MSLVIHAGHENHADVSQDAAPHWFHIHTGLHVFPDALYGIFLLLFFL